MTTSTLSTLKLEDNQICRIPIRFLAESPTNPRKHFDEKPLKELSESIKATGLINPIHIRLWPGATTEINKEDEITKAKFEIVAGARRYKASKLAGLEDVPCIIRDLTDEKVLEIQILENSQREDVHPLDEAEGYAKLLKETKLTVEVIATRVSKPEEYVVKRLRLTKLIDPAKKLFWENEINIGHALLIAPLTDQQQAEILQWMKGEKYQVTVKVLRKELHEEFFLDLNSAPFKKDDEKLVPKAGTCLTCPKQTGNSPSLFGDITKKSICTDRACFGRKIEAFIDRTIEEKAAEGEEVVKISDEWMYNVPKGSLGEEKYQVVPKAEATKSGIYVDGRRRAQLVPIRLRSEEKSSGSAGTGGEKRTLSREELQQRYKRRVQIFGHRIEQEVKNRMFKALLLRLKWPLERKDFELLVPDLFVKPGTFFRDYEIKAVEEAIGIKLPSPGYQFADRVTKLIPTLTDQQLVQLAFATVLQQELIYDPTAGIPRENRFKSLLTRYKSVDRAKITKEVSAELEPKKPKPPKVEEPKKVQKGSKKSSDKKPVAGKKTKKAKTTKRAKK